MTFRVGRSAVNADPAVREVPMSGMSKSSAFDSDDFVSSRPRQVRIRHRQPRTMMLIPLSIAMILGGAGSAGGIGARTMDETVLPVAVRIELDQVSSTPACQGIVNPNADPHCDATPEALNAAADEALKEALAARDTERSAYQTWRETSKSAAAAKDEYERTQLELRSLTEASDNYNRTVVGPAEREWARLQAIVDAVKMPDNHLN